MLFVYITRDLSKYGAISVIIYGYTSQDLNFVTRQQI